CMADTSLHTLSLHDALPISPPVSGAAPTSTTRRSQPASPYRPNTSSTPSGNSPPRCRRCSSSTTSKPTTWTSTSTTASSPPAPTCTHTPPTWTRGTDEKKPPPPVAPQSGGEGPPQPGPHQHLGSPAEQHHPRPAGNSTGYHGTRSRKRKSVPFRSGSR